MAHLTCGPFAQKICPELRMKREKRVSRLIKLILMVQARSDWRPRELAAELGVSQTRLHQDIRELTQAGVPVYFGQGGYKISEGFSMGPTRLSTEEVLDLVYPPHLFADGEQSDGTSSAALDAKLAACLPESLRGRFESGRIRVGSSTVRSPLFRRLHEAVAERRRIRARYASRSSGRTADRELDPYALIFRRHAWYLIARCLMRAEVRKFRVSRIRSVSFTPVHFPEPKGFSLEEYTRGWWEVFGGDPVNVAVRFARRVADLIRDGAPRPGQSIQELPGGDIIYRVNVRGIREISWWIMQYGPDAEALEPPELRALMCENARRMLQLYEEERFRHSMGAGPESLDPVERLVAAGGESFGGEEL
jgi:predicted DNA-binding transcriptional regulator YafY